MQSTSKDIPVLNGLRGLAVMIVFASHASNIFYQGEIVGWGGGQLGVMLFFMLSGFLMAHLYAGRAADVAAQWQFVINRMARIYPLFAVVVFACFVIHSFNAPVWSYRIVSPQDVLVHLSFVRGYNIFWTIGPEVIFYLLFLILWKVSQTSGLAFTVIIFSTLVISWLPITVVASNSVARLHNTLPYFLAGYVLGLRSDSIIELGRRRYKWASLAFWMCLIVFAASLPQVIRLFADVPKRLTGDPWPDPWSFPFYLLATGCLFVTSIVAAPWLLTNCFASFVGKISFSFYLLHFAVLQNMKDSMPEHPLRAIVLAFIATTVLSSCTYVAIETPMRRLIRRLGSYHPRPTQIA